MYKYIMLFYLNIKLKTYIRFKILQSCMLKMKHIALAGWLLDGGSIIYKPKRL